VKAAFAVSAQCAPWAIPDSLALQGEEMIQHDSDSMSGSDRTRRLRASVFLTVSLGLATYESACSNGESADTEASVSIRADMPAVAARASSDVDAVFRHRSLLRAHDWTLTESWQVPTSEADATPALQRISQTFAADVERSQAVSRVAADLIVEAVERSVQARAVRSESLLEHGELMVLSSPNRVALARSSRLPPIEDEVAGKYVLLSACSPKETLIELYGADPEQVDPATRTELEAPFVRLALARSSRYLTPTTGPWYELLRIARRLDTELHARWTEKFEQLTASFANAGLYYSAFLSSEQFHLLQGLEPTVARERAWTEIREDLERDREDDPLTREERGLRALVAFVLASEGAPAEYRELYQEDTAGIRGFVQVLADRVPRAHLLTALRFMSMDATLIRSRPTRERAKN